MSEMVFCIATRGWDNWAQCVHSWNETSELGWHREHIVVGKDVLPAYQEAFEMTKEPILSFIHDDVVIYQKGWDRRVLHEFNDPAVGMVGFAGGLRHGRSDIYRSPYDLPQLGRFGFRSNLRTAEVHGTRFKGECDIAVLDGLSMIVRRSILEKAGGWPLGTPIGYYCYDYWLSCEVRRQGYRIRLVGVDVDHLGGKSSGFISPTASHAESHRWLYDHSRDVLPFEVK